MNRKDVIKSKEEMSFLLGYYSHLITDVEIQRTIREPQRVTACWERIMSHPVLSKRAEGMPQGWDTVKLIMDRKERRKDFYVVEREYLDSHPDSGYFTEIKGLESFPDYIDYLPHNAIPNKIKVMYYMPEL